MLRHVAIHPRSKDAEFPCHISMMDYKIATCGSIDVCYLERHDGGGITLEEDFAACVKQHIGRVDRLFEWCAGPGFIGYSLLGQDLCNSLCLADINPEVVEACKATVQRNHLENRVTVYLSDCLDSIPETEQWDLVVGNPPHCNTPRPYAHFGSRMLYLDEEWATHDKFYRQVGGHLKENGNVLFIEHASFSQPGIFQNMIKKSGLTFTGIHSTRLPSRLYYIQSTKHSR